MTFKLKLLDYEEMSTQESSNGRKYLTPIGPLPSVTTILSLSDDKGWLEDWKKRIGEEEANRIKEEAAHRGSLFHELNEKFLLNQPIEWKKIDMLTKMHFQQIKRYMIQNIECVYGSEIPVYSRKLKCAGRTDGIVQIDGKIKVLDFKTSKHEKETVEDYRMQCSAYIYMLNEMFDLGITEYVVLISNLYENHCTVFEGDYRDHIQKFAELRLKWSLQNT